MVSPFVPPDGDNFSTRLVNDVFKDESDVKFKEILQEIDDPEIQGRFEGYYYDYQAKEENFEVS